MTKETLKTANDLNSEIEYLERNLQTVNESRKKKRISEAKIGLCYFQMTDEEAEAILLRMEAETSERLKELKRQFEEL